MKEIKVTQKRHYSAHNDLIRVAGNFLYACEHEERWCGEGDFVSLVMCALAVESLCNTVGELAFEGWKTDFEQCSPKAKIRIICEKLGIKYDGGQEPFQTLHWIIRFRNTIAHAKPEQIEIESCLTTQEYNELCSGDGPQSKIENEISIEKAKKGLEQINNFIGLLFSRLPEENAWVVQGDFWEMYSAPNSQS